MGALDRTVDSTGRAWQVLLRFDPDGSRSRVYVKHSTADAVAFERPDWEPTSALPTFELGGAGAGATICHDHYLGLLPRALARRDARLWVNPSFVNVTDIKWSSILRLRAVENRFFSLCTLHCDVNKHKTHPFAFSPDGTELSARQAGSDTARPLSECFEAGSIYVIDLDMAKVSEAARLVQDLVRQQTQAPQEGEAPKAHFCCLERRTPGRPRMWGPGKHRCRLPGGDRPRFRSTWEWCRASRFWMRPCVFQVLDHAKQMKCAPIVWNHWERLPADSARLATLMMGRAIECCAPVVISDGDRIHETRGASKQTQDSRTEGH